MWWGSPWSVGPSTFTYLTTDHMVYAERICPVCGKEFSNRNIDMFTCSSACFSMVMKWKKEHLKEIEKEKLKRESIERNILKRSLPSKASQRPDYVKWKARKAVELAIRYKRIERPSLCSECNKEGKIEAHHQDHTKSLEITWLCKSCHSVLNKRALDAYLYSPLALLPLSEVDNYGGDVDNFITS